MGVNPMRQRAALVPILDRDLRPRRLRRWRACGLWRFSCDNRPNAEGHEAREKYQFHRRSIICETRPANEKQIDTLLTARQAEAYLKYKTLQARAAICLPGSPRVDTNNKSVFTRHLLRT